MASAVSTVCKVHTPARPLNSVRAVTKGDKMAAVSKTPVWHHPTPKWPFFFYTTFIVYTGEHFSM